MSLIPYKCFGSQQIPICMIINNDKKHKTPQYNKGTIKMIKFSSNIMFEKQSKQAIWIIMKVMEACTLIMSSSQVLQRRCSDDIKILENLQIAVPMMHSKPWILV